MLLAAACTRDSLARDAGTGAEVEDEAEQARIVPEGLSVSALAGGTGVLELTALTLQRRGDRVELYAALKNVGDVPACSAALSVELFDAGGHSLAAGIGGLLTQRFFRRTDGSDMLAACIAPGDVTMAALLDLPSELVVQEVRSLVYRCPYFALDVAPVASVTIRDVKRVQRGAASGYRGTLVNGLAVALKKPSVSVFPTNSAGRPLGMVSVSAAMELAPGGEWSFETDALPVRGVDQRAFPAGELMQN